MTMPASAPASFGSSSSPSRNARSRYSLNPSATEMTGLPWPCASTCSVSPLRIVAVKWIPRCSSHAPVERARIPHRRRHAQNRGTPDQIAVAHRLDGACLADKHENAARGRVPLTILQHRLQFECETQPLGVIFVHGHGAIARVTHDDPLHFDVLVPQLQLTGNVDRRESCRGLSVGANSQHEYRRKQR